MKCRDLLQMIEHDGWRLVRVNGSHRVYQHPVKKGIVVLAWHARNDDVPVGTFNSILRQAGLK